MRLLTDCNAAGPPNPTLTHSAGTGLANLIVVILNHHTASRTAPLDDSALNPWAFLIGANTTRTNFDPHLGLSRYASANTRSRENEASGCCAE
jgi:hypothetical protein